MRILNEANGATSTSKSPVRTSFVRKEQEDLSAIPPPPPIAPTPANRLKGKNKGAHRTPLTKELSKLRAPSPLQPARSRALLPAKHSKLGRSSRTPSTTGGEREPLAERAPGVGSIVNTSAAFQQPQHPSASSLLSTAPVLPPKSLLPGLLDLNANAQAARPKPPSFESPDGIFAFNPLPGALYLPVRLTLMCFNSFILMLSYTRDIISI